MTRLASPPPTEQRSWRQQVTSVVADVEAESAAYNQVTPPRQALRKVVVVLVTSVLVLILINYLRSGANPEWLLTSLGVIGLDSWVAYLENALLGDGNVEFNRLVMFTVVSIVAYLALPFIAIKLILGERIRDYGLRVSGSWQPYAVLFAISVPFLVLASFNGEFQAKYPFYDIATGESWWPYLWGWWALYGLQFAALEFFFRGFMVHGLKLKLGFTAVFVMMVPYAMIHFGKPMPETLAAIVGAIVLGYLSLKTNSVWWGVAIHAGIAGTMDILALAQTGLL
jgi:hypothetical protein